MKKEDVFQLVSRFLIDEFEIEESRIDLKVNLFKDLELDSIDALDMIAHLEAETGLEFEESELKNIRTIEDVIGFVMSKLDKEA